MPYPLQFDTLYEYDPKPSGISIPVSLRLSGEPVDLVAKLDTGASFCIFQREYGERLGLTIENGRLEWVSTTRERFLTYGHEVTLEALGLSVDAMVYFTHDRDFPRNVLGRNGWLNRVRIAIVDHDCQLYVSPYGG